jgi:C4-type Zn-finger protein
MPNEYETECPFCGKVTLKAIQTFVSVPINRNASRIESGKNDVLLSTECSNCKKTQKEIIRKFKENGIRYR